MLLNFSLEKQLQMSDIIKMYSLWAERELVGEKTRLPILRGPHDKEVNLETRQVVWRQANNSVWIE